MLARVPKVAVKALALILIRLYQRVLSPVLGTNCRFSPSCSQYAAEAIEKHGSARGVVLAARRLVRCGPWSPGGFDPVPRAGTPDSPGDDGGIPSL